MKDDFIALYNRDLNRLYKEIEAYNSETSLWETIEGTSNSAGNLALHLVGNLNEYIGCQLGGLPYTRYRDVELLIKDIPQKGILHLIETTQKVVEKSLKGLKAKQFKEIYPENVLGYDMTVHYFLVHLNGHFNYHLGQINYHRRILEGITD